ncbi:MAG: hypothetical protein CUN55_04860 [Phototrophicales bacterium]|nr:MAG: hypothetical protein CUN55_04860 [Phototrophicales bacterium]
MSFMRRYFWWIILGSGLFAIAFGVALLLATQNELDFATRGWEIATRDRPMPIRPLPIAGINVELTQYDEEALDAQLEAIASLGFVQVRQPIYWALLEPEEGEYDWSVYDHIIQAVDEHPQLELIAVLDGTPEWARSRLAPEHPFAPPASVSAFGTFAANFAARYRDQIDYYQIWDEPNLRSHWGNTDPEPAIYTAMLQVSYTAIHNNDPTATVIAAALAPTIERGPANYNEIEYLNAIYTHGGGDYFDAAAGKPYGYNTSAYDRHIGNFNFSRIILMRETLIAHGDADKPIWASNFGWNHLPEDWVGPPSIWGQVSAEQQVQYTKDAFQRAIEEWPWLAGLVLQHWQPDAPADDPIQGFAIAPSPERWVNAVPNIKALQPSFYPVDPNNPYQEFEGYWQFGPLGADALPISDITENPEQVENRVDITFYGTNFGLLVRRYDVITGYYIVEIDGQPANALPRNRQGEAQIVLKAVGSGEALDLIEVARDLEKGIHTATIFHRPRQGDDAWGLAGIAVGVAPDVSSNEHFFLFAYGLIAAGLLSTIIAAWRLPWGSVRFPSRQTLQNGVDLTLTLTFSAIFVLGSALTWGDAFTALLKRDPLAILLTLATIGIAFISPIAILSVLSLFAFAIIVFNRPLMGLLATLFWSMFFASTIDAYIRLIATVEAMLFISLLATIGRGLYDWAKLRRQEEHFNWLQAFFIASDTLLKRLIPIDLGVLALFALGTFSITWADLRPEAMHELRVMIIGPTLFYILLRSLRFSASDLSLLIDTAIIGGMIIALIGLKNYFTNDAVVLADGSRRLIAVYGSPNAVALQLGRILPFTLAYAIVPLSAWRRGFGLITTAILGIAFLLTQSLGGIVIGMPLTVAMLLLTWQGQRAWRWIVSMGIMGFLALIPLSRLIPRLRNLTDFNSATTVFRINVWRSTLELLRENPLTGVGLDQFLYAYRSRYIMPEGAADPNLSHPHNILLEHWVRFGIWGIVAFLYTQWHFWKTVLHLLRPIRLKQGHLWAILLGCIGSMTYTLAHGLVDAGIAFINLSYFYVFLLGALTIILNLEQTLLPSSQDNEL